MTRGGSYIFDFGSDCQSAIVGFRSKGGKVVFPGLPEDNDNFYGHTFYAPFQGQGGIAAVVECPGSDNAYDVPVPPGSDPDLFEYLKFSQHSTEFESASVFGEIYSTTWVSKESYFLYVYDDKGNILASYQMGPLKKKKSMLKFASPFENGLTVPADGILDLEIVHSTQ